MQALQGVADAGEGRAQLMLGDREEVVLEILDLDQPRELRLASSRSYFWRRVSLTMTYMYRAEDDEQPQPQEKVVQRHRVEPAI